MKKIDYINCAILSLFAFISRMPLLEKFQSHWDGPQYSIAIVQYSFEQFTPAPPGYPFYIALGKFFTFFTHDPHRGILAVSVLGSILGTVVLYIVGTRMYHRYVGVIASTIFLTGSTFYYFGLTPYAYILLIPTTTLLAYNVYQIFVKRKQEGILLGIIFGICFGIRPQETIQIGLLYLLGFLFLSTKEKIKSLLIFFVITLIWFIPMLYAIGLEKYFVLSYEFAKTAAFNNSFSQHIELMIKGYLLSFGVAGGFIIYYLWSYVRRRRHYLPKNKRIIIFYLVWIAPGFFYNLFLRTEHAGYQMSYLAGFLLLIAYAIWQVTKKNKIVFIASLAIIALFNLYWFFYDRDPTYTKPYRPTSFHYSDIRKNDLKVGSKVHFITEHFDPKTTLIITEDTLWRPYMYHLKEYHLTNLSGLTITTPRFIPIRRDAKAWEMYEFENKKLSVTIPDGVTKIVFPDDEAHTWIKNYPFKTYSLPGNSTVTAITVPQKAKLQYDYHKISISK